ncbi:MAG: right-handed parallel beta-helix repeat-containing protein [Thermodesulfobacteriota bacterium]
MRLHFGFLILFLAIALTNGAMARDIYVPDDLPTIGDAMDDAAFGDSVYVKAGTYNERIKIKEGVNLVSFAGADGNDLVDGPGNKKVLRRTLRTIIDGSGLKTPGYLISFPQETTAPVRLDGFTIQNLPKYREPNVFLVEVRASSPEVVNNIVTGNRSWGGILSTGLGAGMGPPLKTEARPVIRNNVIYDNYGTGISNAPNATALVMDNELFENRFPGADEAKGDLVGAGIGVRESGRPIIDNNVCYRNGVGIGGLNLDSHDRELIIRNNILYNNKTAGIGLRPISSEKSNIRAVIENNKVYGNLLGGMRLSKMDSVVVRYNTVSYNRMAGLLLTNVDEAFIEDNEIYDNLTAGIRLLDVPALTIRRNHIYQNSIAGIDFIGWDR